MKGYKSVLRAKSRRKSIVFERFAVNEAGSEAGRSVESGVLIADESENCDLSGGTLKRGWGVQTYAIPNGSALADSRSLPKADAYFHIAKRLSDGSYEDKPAFITDTGVLYVYGEQDFAVEHVFTGRVRCASLMDGEQNVQTVFLTENGLFLYDEAEGVVPLREGKTGISACVCKSRLFCVAKPFTLLYSAPLNGSNFASSIDDGGEICLPSDWGEIVALATMKDSVYVFYERGIARVETAGSAREFSVTKIGYGGGRIFGDSVGVCAVGGEKAFFLTTDGLYSFDGARAKKICRNLQLSPLEVGQVCNHAEKDGKYFVCFTDKKGEKRGVIVDAESGLGYRAFAAKGLSGSRGKVLCSAAGYIYEAVSDGVLPSGAEALFSVEKTDFGTEGVKTLHSVRITGAGEAEVSVSNGVRKKTRRISLDGGEQTVRVGLRGTHFTLALRLKNSAVIRKVCVDTEMLAGSGLSNGGSVLALGRRREG